MFGTKTISVITMLCAAPVLAQTDCPTRDAMERGVRLTFPDGLAEIYRDGGDSLVTVDAPTYRMELGQGTHLLTYEDIIDGVPQESSQTTYDYGMAQTELRVPAPGKRWSVPVKVTDSSGIRDEAQMQAYGDLETVTIGDCTYDMIEVVIAYDREDMYMESLHYLPEFSLTYLAWSGTEGETPSPVIPTDITAIRK